MTRKYKKRILKTHCKRGHAFTPENTRIRPNGARLCRTCASERLLDWRAAHPDMVAAGLKRWRQEHPDYQKPQAICKACKRMLKMTAFGLCTSCYCTFKRNLIKQALFEKQGGHCAVQGCKIDTSNYTLGDWHLDHDHTCHAAGQWCSKCIRGLLCKSCNAALGHAQDSVIVLQGMIRYLQRSRS